MSRRSCTLGIRSLVITDHYEHARSWILEVKLKHSAKMILIKEGAISTPKIVDTHAKKNGMLALLRSVIEHVQLR